MLISKSVIIKWNGRNREWYQSKGYGEYLHSQPFDVDIKDLMPTSPIKVEVSCDYCGEISLKKYLNYIVARKEVEIDCCIKSECQNKKREAVLFHRHGVTNAQGLDWVKSKTESTMMSKYGVKNPMDIDGVKDKLIANNLEKYGVPYHTQTMEWKDKVKLSNLEKYGVEHVTQLQEVKDRIAETNLIKYGNTHALSNPEIKAKSIKTKFKNGTGISSTQQRLLNKVIGGELNYPYYGAMLDIAFPNEKLYLEYNGGGHWLSVKLGDETIEEFEERNRRRWYSLYRDGWKEIRITSLKDKLPSDDKLIEMFNTAKSKLINNSWVHFDIDNGIIENSKMVIEFDYGILRNTYRLNY